MKNIILILIVLASSCGGGNQAIRDPLINSSEPLFTMVNMRFDENKNSISSIGYQKFRLLKVCTPVTVNALFTRSIEFTVKDSGRRISFTLGKHTRLPVQTHLNRLIGPTCPTTDGLSTTDQEGIAEGKAVNGMTRDGVRLALGYPPEHKTSNLDNSTWIYWNSSFGQFQVKFGEDGLVNNRDVAP